MATAAQTGDVLTTQRIVNDLDANFIVEAGAGTGKTYALVSRVVALVKDGQRMPEIVAITFTEAAAAELSERIRSRMEQLLDSDYRASSGDLLAEKWHDDHRRLVETAIAELDQAAIQTIHSFAARLLRERPLSVGLPPGFTVQDEVETKEHFSEQWDEWLDWSLGKDTGVGEDLQDNLRCLLEADVKIGDWQKIARSFAEKQDRLKDVSNIPDWNLGDVCETALRQLDDVRSKCRDTSDTMYKTVIDTISATEAVLSVANKPLLALELLNDGQITFPSARGRTDRNWEIPAADVRAQINDIIRPPVVNAIKVAPLLPLLHSLRQHFAIDYAARRKAEGVATFDDLLVWARDLLRDDAEARRHFQNKYSHILIDEFQDTDPLQAELAFYLAAEPDTNIHGQPWHTLPLMPGKLFIVGDAKQSIYRFRSADIAVVQQVKDGGQLESLTLSENRRSQQPVLDWVNAVFGGPDDDAEGLMQPEAGIQAEYIRLQTNDALQQPGLGTVQVFGGPPDENEEDESTDAVRRWQATHVASLVIAYAGAGASATRLNVYDKDAKELRPANLGDVCILIRSRTGLGILTRGLENATIPYRLEGSSLFFNTQEVQDLLNCLRAIDSPADEVSVVAALRSPAFACSDADLLRWRDACRIDRGDGNRSIDYPIWNYQSRRLAADADNAESDGEQSAEEKQKAAERAAQRARLQKVTSVWDGMQQLRDYHERSRTDSVAQLIAQFIRERRLDELDLADNRPREVWRRRQFLAEQARNLEYAAATSPGVPPLTLRRFLAWADSQEEENAKITEVAVPETDDDAVRIMTMHGAKGLEFPIVILLGLENNPTARSGRGNPRVLFNSTTGKAEVLAKSPGRNGNPPAIQTPDYPAALEAENSHAIAEGIRLAYVGATRARDHLLVSLYHKPASENSRDKIVADRLQSLRQDMADKGLHQEPNIAPDGDARYSGSRPAPAKPGRYINAWNKQRDAAIDKHSRPQAITATRLARSGGDVVVDDKEVSTEHGRTTGRGGRGGTAFGSALHSVLQNVVDEMQAAGRLPLPADAPVADLVAQYDDRIKELSESAGIAQGLNPSQRNEVIRLSRRALQNESVETALRAPRLWAEIPVAAPIDTPEGQVVIEGIIDLMYMDNDGDLVILDYKSDVIGADDLDSKMEHYQWQGAAYAATLARAAAVQQAIGNVKDVQFLFVRLDGPARSVADLPRLMSAVPQRAVTV